MYYTQLPKTICEFNEADKCDKNKMHIREILPYWK